jgi:electron transfer flavoprotein alpha subunit
VVVDTIENQLNPQCLELLGFADQLQQCPTGTVLFIAGKEVGGIGEQLARQWGRRVLVCEHDELYYPNPELLRLLLLHAIEEFGPKYVCFLHTVRGCQTAAALSVSLGGSCVTAVEACVSTDEGPAFRRSVVNGKLLQTVRPAAPLVLLTVLPGAYAPVAPLPRRLEPGAPVLRRMYTVGTCGYLPKELIRESESGPGLEDAEIVIAAGRGVGKKEHLTLCEELARLFPRAILAASRPVCDLKWLPYSRQVGVTGRTVTPRLYLACGISGAQQHLAGMKGSRFIVAINTDPHAAIFAVADCIIVEDLCTFLPLLTRKYKERFNLKTLEELTWEPSIS